MKKLIGLCALLGLSFSLTAKAVNIELATSQSNLDLGQNLELQLQVSGLEGSKALGVYDLDLHYDTSLFSLSSITWGDASKGNQLDLSGYGSFQDSRDSGGQINLFELSFDEPDTLTLDQAGEFTLVSLVFKSIALGSGHFALFANSLGDAMGENLPVGNLGNSQVNVTGVSVPEPSSLMLFLGFAALLAARNQLAARSQK